MTDDRITTLHFFEQHRMRCEGERLRTFRNWPAGAPISSGDLAKAGFFFLGPGDKVKCFCCGGVLRYWVHGDSPTTEHKRHFPTCSFMLGRAVGNIPLHFEQGSSDSVDGQLLGHIQRLTLDNQGTTGQAVYPEMEAEDSRLITFHNWPTGAPVQPDVLARAGFYYTAPIFVRVSRGQLSCWLNEDANRTVWIELQSYLPGHGDNVKCFYCDGGLRNWEPEDDPWQEHAKWFPRCEFLIQSRGPEYISTIQDSHFHLGETTGGSQLPISSSRNNVVGGVGASSAMLSPAVQTVAQMGFETSLVESLVQTKYLLTGCHYMSVSDLVSDVLQAEEADGQRGTQHRVEPEVRGPSAEGVRTSAPMNEKVGDPSPEELLRQLQEERTCKVCMDKHVSIVFIPCGHLVVCGECAPSLRHCPICRAVIRGSVRTFMS